MNEVQKYALKFVEDNYLDIDYDRIDYTDKEELIQDIKKQTYIASWVITEVLSWGMKNKNNFLKELEVEHDGDFLVISIKDKYYRYNNKIYDFEIVEVKTKQVIYFD